MALPKLTKTINYIPTALPSGRTIGIRGWKVRDEKELLFALDVDENAQTHKTKYIINFLRNCTDNQKTFDLLSEADLCKLAIEIRKLSKGDRIEYTFKCRNIITSPGISGQPPTEKICGNLLEDEVQISLNEVIQPFNIAPVEINSGLIVLFKDISYNKTLELYEQFKDSPSKYAFYVLINSIEALTIEGVSYTNFTVNELEEFVDDLDSDDLKKLNTEFNKSRSSVKLEKTLKCRRCGQDVRVDFGDLLSFLVL